MPKRLAGLTTWPTFQKSLKRNPFDGLSVVKCRQVPLNTLKSPATIQVKGPITEIQRLQAINPLDQIAKLLGGGEADELQL